jgi:hypothetical protein
MLEGDLARRWIGHGLLGSTFEVLAPGTRFYRHLGSSRSIDDLQGAAASIRRPGHRAGRRGLILSTAYAYEIANIWPDRSRQLPPRHPPAEGPELKGECYGRQRIDHDRSGLGRCDRSRAPRVRVASWRRANTRISQGALADIIGVGCARRLGRSCSVFRGPPPTLTEQLVSSTRVSSTGATRGPGRRQVSSGLSPRV